jgi:hypothetical protein
MPTTTPSHRASSPRSIESLSTGPGSHLGLWFAPLCSTTSRSSTTGSACTSRTAREALRTTREGHWRPLLSNARVSTKAGHNATASSVRGLLAGRVDSPAVDEPPQSPYPPDHTHRQATRLVIAGAPTSRPELASRPRAPAQGRPATFDASLSGSWPWRCSCRRPSRAGSGLIGDRGRSSFGGCLRALTRHEHARARRACRHAQRRVTSNGRSVVELHPFLGSGSRIQA